MYKDLRGTFAFLIVLTLPGVMLAQSAVTPSPHIHVDQFGYRPESDKVAVLSNPEVGNNADEEYVPGASLEIRRWSDSSTVLTGATAAWNGGLQHVQSGDLVWWFDFSALQTPGTYFVYDATNDLRSYPFEIKEDVYSEVLAAAVKMFYFNRCNTEKLAAHATNAWADGTSFLGTMQDSDAWLVGSSDPATSRDLSGGWFDAGDYNKYINFADGPLHQLLDAYTGNPDIWGDNSNIPESGNGISDILDEIKWELDWFLKMQESNGSVLHKVSNLTFNAASPPSADTEERRYAPATYSATASATAVFAHAARVFEAESNSTMQAFGGTLRNAALLSWSWLEANPAAYSAYDNAGFVNATAEDNEYVQMTNTAISAIHLFALTGDNSYRDFVDNSWTEIHLNQWTFAYVFESEIQDAFLFYSTLNNATPAVAADVRADYSTSINNTPNNFPAYGDDSDAYRAYMTDDNHGWGNNRDKSLKGDMYLNMLRYGIVSFADSDYKKAAEEYIHYIHGVNPMNMTYLTNMALVGAENSASTMYHSWFSDGSPLWDQVGVSTYGPPPGYVTGGVNPDYAPEAGPVVDPPQNQPILKSYLDFNDGYPEASWEVTEPSITYQAAYIRLLSEFVSSEAPLAIDTIYLNGKISEDNIELDWSVSGEPTGESVQVEYRTGDAVDFIELASVDVQTRSVAINRNRLNGQDHYFRLRHLELDGSVIFSNVVKIETDIDHSHTLAEIYPNPSAIRSTLRINPAQSDHLKAELFDSNGRSLGTLFDELVREGEIQSIDLDNSQLSNGIYFVKIYDSSTSSQLKMVVLN